MKNTKKKYLKYYLHSQVDVSLNCMLNTTRVYLETTLNYGKDTKQSHLSLTLFYAQTPIFFYDTHGDNNEGLQIQHNLASKNHNLDLMKRLHADIFTKDRYMLNGINIKIKLTPSKDVFNLMVHDNTDDYKHFNTYATLLVAK